MKLAIQSWPAAFRRLLEKHVHVPKMEKGGSDTVDSGPPRFVRETKPPAGDRKSGLTPNSDVSNLLSPVNTSAHERRTGSAVVNDLRYSSPH